MKAAVTHRNRPRPNTLPCRFGKEATMAGLFDFVKNIGKKIFGAGDDPAAKIRELIQKDNPGVKDLTVTFNDGTVALKGSGTPEALQKAVLMAGNVMGVGEVKVEGAAKVED